MSASSGTNTATNAHLFQLLCRHDLIRQLKVNELKACLRNFGCVMSGLKDDCRRRLENFVASQVAVSSPDRFRWIITTIYQQKPFHNNSPEIINLIKELQNPTSVHSAANQPPNSANRSSTTTIIIRRPPSAADSISKLTHSFSAPQVLITEPTFLPFDPNSWTRVLPFTPNFLASPFYRIIELAAKPKLIEMYGKPISRRFLLSKRHADLLRSTHNIRKLPKDQQTSTIYSLMLFCFPYSVVQSGERNHGVAFIEFPHKTSVCVNGLSVSGIIGQNNQQSGDQPVDITPYVIAENGLHLENTVKMSWSCATKRYMMAIYLVHRIPPAAIEKAFMASTLKTVSADQIRLKFFSYRDENRECLIEQSVLSMRCPITCGVIKIPVRGKNCNHVQTFDLMNYLMLNEQFPEWKCPVCQQKDWIESTGVSARNKLSVETTDGCLTALSFPPEGEQSGLQICGYMMEILQKVPRETLDSSSSISIDPHGVWSIASTDSINDDDEEEDGFEFKRKRSDSVDDVIDLDRNIEHTTPEVIDLTFDSDDNGQSD